MVFIGSTGPVGSSERRIGWKGGGDEVGGTPKAMGGIANSSSEHAREPWSTTSSDPRAKSAIGGCSSEYAKGGSGGALLGGGGGPSDSDRNCVSSSSGTGKGGSGGLWGGERCASRFRGDFFALPDEASPISGESLTLVSLRASSGVRTTVAPEPRTPVRGFDRSSMERMGFGSEIRVGLEGA